MNTRIAALILTTIHCSLFTIPCSAAVPLRWTVETSRVQPAVFEAFHGESLDLEASFTSYGKPLETPVQGDWKIYWQTNGMADAWWSAPATVQQPTTDNQQPATTATAVFTPAMDPGASVVTGFIGLPGENYRAAFIIRFRHAPGATPNALPLPAKTLDFAVVQVANAPYYTKVEADRAIGDAITSTVTKSYVEALGISGGGGGGAVNSVNGMSGDVLLSAGDIPSTASHFDYVSQDIDELYGQAEAAYYSAEGANAAAADALGRASNAEDAAQRAQDAADEGLAYSRGVYQFMHANTNAWFAGTNYVLGADASARQHFQFEPGMDLATVPCSMSLMERRDGQKQVVWDQRDWVSWYWTFKAGQMRREIAATNAAIYAAINAPENHAWARRYAATGRENPDPKTTFVDTPRVCLSPGMTWETVAEVGGCGYWTIVGNGAMIGGSGTNATLTVRDFEGNELMTITKGEHRLAWLESSDFVGQMTDADGWICFDMRSDVQPVGYYSTTLETDDFTPETDAGCPARFRWEDRGGGVWRIHFTLKPGIVSPSCFAKFQYEVQGASEVRYKAGLVVEDGIIFNGKKIAPVIPANAAVGDTVVWKVVR